MARDIADIERELCESLDAKVAAGATIIRGGGNTTCGCPLQLWSGRSGFDDVRDTARDAFGWSSDQTNAFFGGFDGDTNYHATERHPAIAALGARLAAKYIDNAKGGA